MPDFYLKYTGEEIEARLDKVTELETGKASLWDSEKQYAKGDFCVHKGYLWVCTSAAGNTGTEPSTNYNVWNVTYSNPNLLDNPWFTVNQRGQSEYNFTGADGYTVDRYFLENSTLNVTDNGVELGVGGVLIQYEDLESCKNLVGKTVTVSIRTSDGEIFAVTNLFPDIDKDTTKGFSTTLANGLGVSVISFSVQTDKVQTLRLFAAESLVTIKAVKLELGPVSTLANDTAPDYATELLKCQRYFQKDYIHTTRYNSSSSAEAVNVFLKTNMRTVPSIVITECAYWNGSVWTPVNYTIPDQLGSAGYFSCWANAIPTGQQINIIVRYEASADL